MKRKQTDESSQSESKKAKSTTHDHSSWFNSAVLLNVYSFLTFREVLTFRLVNQSINKELRISSESIESNDNELFFLNRLSKMNAKVKDESCDFLQGCLLKVNAEIRNCMVLDDRISYFQYLLESDTNFNVLCMNKTYSNLFKSGIVSFNSYVGGVFSQTQGGRSELKILKKSKEFMIFTQHYVYGPNTRVDNLERSYDLKVRDSNFQEKNLIWYLNYYYTWEDEPMGSGKIDINAINNVMKELEIPSEWDWKAFLTFLMTCAGAKEYCCMEPMVDTNSNVMKSMIKELKSKDDDAFNKSAESIEVQEGLKCLETILNPIVHSDLSFSQKMEYFDMIRSEILKQSARKAHNLFLFEESWLNRDFNINIDETMFQQLKSKLKYYTIHEAYYIGFTEYIQEERFFATAVFELANGKLTEISLKHEMLYAFTEEERDTISLEIDGQEEDSTIPQLIENILGIDLEKVDDEMEIIQNFCKCLLKLVGKCHRINITESTEMTFTLKYFPKPIKEAVEQLSDL